METGISFKNWPEPQEFANFLKETLNKLGLSNLESSYITHLDENADDMWLIQGSGTNTNPMLITLTVPGDNLDLDITTLNNAPPVEWLAEQLHYHISQRPDTISRDLYTPTTYREWSLAKAKTTNQDKIWPQKWAQEAKSNQIPAFTPLYE